MLLSLPTTQTKNRSSRKTCCEDYRSLAITTYSPCSMPLSRKIATRMSAKSRRSFTSANVDAVHGMAHLVFGANTDVGKSVVTAGLIRACGGLSLWDEEHASAHYIKPLQCGGSDQGFVQRQAQKEVASAHTLFEWASPTSPHIAARMENHPVSDIEVTTALKQCLTEIREDREHLPIWIETAGGVLSPSSASPDNNEIQHAKGGDKWWGWTPQGDLYREFRADMDVILVGDGRLGGISTTLTSLESLLCRGFNVAGLIVIENGYSNQQAFQEYASRSCPPPFGSSASIFRDPTASIISLPALPPQPEPLDDWYKSADVSEKLGSFVKEHLTNTWQRRYV